MSWSRGRILGLTGAAALFSAAVAGCGSAGGTSAGGAPAHGVSPTARPASPSAAASQQKSPSVAASLSATAAALPAAANGTNLSACASGSCEVLAGAGAHIPVPSSLLVEDVKVESVTANTVTIVGNDLGDQHGGTCSGNSCTASGSGDGFQIEMGSGSTGTENNFSVSVIAIEGGQTILRIARTAG